MKTASSLAMLGTVFLSHAYADQTLYRCVVNGKTTYTDKPCAAASPSAASASSLSSGHGGKPSNRIAIDYTTPYGVWRGQAQYQATLKGQVVPEAHAVVPLVIEVGGQGKVRGASTENGCKMLGVATPYVAPNMLTLDVTLSECRYPALNRRYSGMLALYKSNNSVQFSLQSFNTGLAAIGKGAAHFDIKATMRR